MCAELLVQRRCHDLKTHVTCPTLKTEDVPLSPSAPMARAARNLPKPQTLATANQKLPVNFSSPHESRRRSLAERQRAMMSLMIAPSCLTIAVVLDHIAVVLDAIRLENFEPTNLSNHSCVALCKRTLLVRRKVSILGKIRKRTLTK